MGDTTIEIIVIDDHRVVGLGVTAAFNNRGVDASISWAPTVRDAKRLRGQIAILDLRLADGSDPDRNIADLTERAIPVVVYTSGDDPYLVRRAIAGGALSIIRKSAPPEDLVEAVLAAADGATFPTPTGPPCSTPTKISSPITCLTSRHESSPTMPPARVLLASRAP